VKSTPLSIQGLDAYAVEGVLGDVYTMDIPDGWESPYLTAVVVGSVEQTCANYPNTATRLSVGDVGLSGGLVPPNAGAVTRTVISDRYVRYCLSDPKKRRLHGEAVRLPAGNVYEVQMLRSLFIALGSVHLVGGKALSAPAMIDAVTGPCSVTADSDVIAISLLKPDFSQLNVAATK
jgi:hypothetical protein